MMVASLKELRGDSQYRKDSYLKGRYLWGKTGVRHAMLVLFNGDLALKVEAGKPKEAELISLYTTWPYCCFRLGSYCIQSQQGMSKLSASLHNSNMPKVPPPPVPPEQVV